MLYLLIILFYAMPLFFFHLMPLLLMNTSHIAEPFDMPMARLCF